MRQFLLLSLALLVLAPATEARKKQKKAKYGFELTLHENWKPKISKDKDKQRILLTQRKYDVPSDYIDAPNYTHTPQLIMYVDTTTFGVHAFIDSLTSEDYRSKQKKEILKEFEFLNEPDRVPKRRSRMEIAGESAVLWKAQAKYMKEIQESASSMSGKRVRREYGGAVAAVKVGDNIVLFHLMTEWEFFESVLAEVLPMIKSLVVPTADEDEG